MVREICNLNSCPLLGHVKVSSICIDMFDVELIPRRHSEMCNLEKYVI